MNDINPSTKRAAAILPSLQREQARDRRTDRWAYAAVALITAGFFVVDLVSEMTDGAAAGKPDRWLRLFIADGSSVLVLLALFPVLLWLTRRWPLTLADWRSTLPAYFVTSLLWSGVHVAAMVTIRKLVYPLVYGTAYIFARDDGVLWEFVYEYRKDLLTFVLQIAVIYTFRHIAELRQELHAARREAQRTSRVTLKCGGTTLFLDAHSIEWARAAGNYVEIRAHGKLHLARSTLSGLEAQLQASGADIVRTHRSWLVNRAEVRRVRPTGDGDQSAELSSGELVPVSRRYRDVLAAGDE
jgi:DNA-binding LytR/AlgR family response regulator